MDGYESEIVWQATAALHRYCRAIDQHDAAALSEVFTEDAVLVVGAGGEQYTFSGREAVVGLLSSLFEQREWARHLVANVLIEPGSEGTIEVRSYVHFFLGQQDSIAVGVGDYAATMRESAGVMQISKFSATIIGESAMAPTAVGESEVQRRS